MSGSKPRILVVDDDAGMTRTVARVLGRHYEVACVNSPSEALETAGELSPDIAVVDIRMPEMNGFELMRRLRESLRDVDIIMMTGNLEEPDANLIRAIDEGAYYFIQKPFDRRVLLTLVARCLELRRLRRETNRYTRLLERELEEARQFQESLLPPSEKELLGVSISARFRACKELAGDFYDYTAVGDSAVAVLVADVVGHGASAAMLTGIVKSAFRSAHAEAFEPLAVVERVKEGIRAFEASRFVTLFAARLGISDRRLEYVNAGHPAPIVRRADGEPLFLETTGPLISSALADVAPVQNIVSLDADDLIVLYTDGLIEARGTEGFFGKERLVSLVTRDCAPGGELLEQILGALAEFSGSRPYQDDVTLVGVQLGE